MEAVSEVWEGGRVGVLEGSGGRVVRMGGGVRVGEVRVAGCGTDSMERL